MSHRRLSTECNGLKLTTTLVRGYHPADIAIANQVLSIATASHSLGMSAFPDKLLEGVDVGPTARNEIASMLQKYWDLRVLDEHGRKNNNLTPYPPLPSSPGVRKGHAAIAHVMLQSLHHCCAIAISPVRRQACKSGEISGLPCLRGSAHAGIYNRSLWPPPPRTLPSPLALNTKQS